MTQHVYLVFMNADFTEGRGPMVFHSVFNDFDVADAYVMAQEGIFGSTQERRKSFSDEGSWYYNGYEIRKVEVLNQVTLDDRQERRRQISDLEKQIQELKKGL